MLLRKRREATRSKQTATRSDTKSTGHLPELPKPEHKSDTAVEKKKHDNVAKEPINSLNENDSPAPKHDYNKLLASSVLSVSSHKGLRRRKRDVVTSSNVFSGSTQSVTPEVTQSVSSDNTETVSQDITSTSTNIHATSSDIGGYASTESSQPGSSESTAYQGSSIRPTSTYASSTNNGASFPFYDYAISSYDTSASSSEYSMPWSQDTSSPSVAMSSSAYNNTHWDSEYYDAWAAWYDYYGTSYKPYWYDNEYNYDYYWFDWYMHDTWSDYNEGGSFFFDQLRSKKDEWDERVENFRTVFKNESL